MCVCVCVCVLNVYCMCSVVLCVCVCCVLCVALCVACVVLWCVCMNKIEPPLYKVLISSAPREHLSGVLSLPSQEMRKDQRVSTSPTMHLIYAVPIYIEAPYIRAHIHTLHTVLLHACIHTCIHAYRQLTDTHMCILILTQKHLKLVTLVNCLVSLK